MKQQKIKYRSDKFGGWINHRYLELNGRIRRGIQFPRRERVLLRMPLKRMNIVYRELVPFFNPHHGGYTNSPEGCIQWLDFCVLLNGKLAAIIFHPQYGQSGIKKHERAAFEAKKSFLKERGTEFIVVNRKSTSYEYEIMIRRLKQKVR